MNILCIYLIVSCGLLAILICAKIYCLGFQIQISFDVFLTVKCSHCTVSVPYTNLNDSAAGCALCAYKRDLFSDAHIKQTNKQTEGEENMSQCT
jgi:hypothetical protein